MSRSFNDQQRAAGRHGCSSAMDGKSFTQRLGGQWRGSYGTAACPVCQPEGRPDQLALTISDAAGKLLLHCKKSECAFRDILGAAGVRSGNFVPPDPVAVRRREALRVAETAKRGMAARRIWDETRPVAGTPAETYLRSRGITCALPRTLRFHPACLHTATRSRHPALVALVEGGAGFAVHRTYLRPDGSGKAALAPAKAMLGSVSGGAARLSRTAGPLAVAEGIETALSLGCGLLREPATIWAALSAPGMRALSLPAIPGHLIVASDGDAAGREAALTLAERADALGWDVALLHAPDGQDWNDVLTAKGESA